MTPKNYLTGWQFVEIEVEDVRRQRPVVVHVGKWLKAR
jgi:hypothetical protein